MTKCPKPTLPSGEEDFLSKYEAAGKVGDCLVNHYFRDVERLTQRVAADSLIETALEIGCGPGYSTKRLLAMLPPGACLKASEPGDKQIAVARAMNPDMEIIEEDIYKLQRRDDSLGLVYLLEVLEHLDSPQKGLAEIKRVLAPGGFLILGVPREPLWCALNFARGKYRKDFGNTPGHLNHWSRRSIVRLVSCHFGPVVAVRSPLPWTLVLAQKPEIV